MKKVILFGATGLCGAYTALHLSTLGYHVIAVGRREDNNSFFNDYGIEYISIDIKDKNSFSKLPVDKIFAVIHFAGAMPAHMIGYDPYDYINSIILGTLNILEFSRQNCVQRFIFSQSISDVAYKFGFITPIPADTQMKFPLNNDHSVYSISKNSAVFLIQHYQAAYGIKSFILRLPTIYAYHPNKYYYVDGEKKWLGYRLLIEKACNGDDIEVWGNPNNVKELVYVKDFVKIVQGALESDKSSGGIYNVANGFPLSFDEQIKIMTSVLNPISKKSKIIYLPEKPSSPQFILDVDKTKKDLLYKPEYNCEKYFLDFKLERELQRFKKLWGTEEDYL